MSGRPTHPTLRDRLLSDIADELKSLKGEELQAYLSELGDDGEDASAIHERALEGACAALGRRKLDQANSICSNEKVPIPQRYPPERAAPSEAPQTLGGRRSTPRLLTAVECARLGRRRQ